MPLPTWPWSISEIPTRWSARGLHSLHSADESDRTSDQVRVAGLKESRAGHHVEELGPTAERLANSSPMSLITPTMRAFPMRNALRPGFMSPTSVHPAGNPFSSSRFRRYQHRVLTDRIYRGPLSDWVSICTQISDLKVAWRFNLPICTTFAALGVAAR